MAEPVVVTLDELVAKMSKGTLTTAEKLDLATMLNAQAQQEKEEAFAGNIEKIKALITELGLTIDEVVKALAKPMELIFDWNGNKRYTGQLGKFPEWTKELKKIGKEQALTFVVGGNPKGKEFVEKVFEVKPQ